MEKYIVVYNKGFKDLEDNEHIYKKGDIYPREGLKPTKKRINELSSEKNKIGKVLIEKVEDNETVDVVVTVDVVENTEKTVVSEETDKQEVETTQDQETQVNE